MKKLVTLSLVLSVLALAAVWAIRPAERADETKKEAVYDRIMRTRTIRCGYFVWPPYLVKDPNTGAMTGLFADYMEALANVTGLKVEWSQELNFGTYLQDLADGRYDMECAGGWPNAKRGQIVFYGKPYAYIPYVALVREDDHRFDNDVKTINDPSVKVATMDGETTSILRSLRFPKAQDVSLPQNSPFTDVLLNVATSKADITFSDLLTADQYIKSNPGKLRVVTYDPPLYLVEVMPTLPPDIRMKEMVDVATEQLINTGVIDTMLSKYETDGVRFLRPPLPFAH